MEWSMICRICLQEGNLISIFDTDEATHMTFCEKIMQCSTINVRSLIIFCALKYFINKIVFFKQISRGLNLPEQMCLSCHADLETSYRFRQNCESSDAILQSFVENSSTGAEYLVSSDTGDVYRYKSPTGINVRVGKPLIKSEIEDDENVEERVEDIENDEEEEEILGDTPNQEAEMMEQDDNEQEQNDDDLETEVLDESNDNENENEIQYPEEVLEYDSTDDIISSQLLKDNGLRLTLTKKTSNSKTPKFKPEEFFEISEIIRPVRKSNFSRNKIPPNKPTVEQITTEIGPDGVQTAIIRVKRNLDTIKPLKVCEICGNTYKYRHALDSHMRRHRGEKPFICDYDNCGKSFVIPFELKRHQRIHTGLKPYGKYFFYLFIIIETFLIQKS